MVADIEARLYVMFCVYYTYNSEVNIVEILRTYKGMFAYRQYPVLKTSQGALHWSPLHCQTSSIETILTSLI